MHRAADILKDRELKHLLQVNLQKKLRRSLISLGLNMPGRVKVNDLVKRSLKKFFNDLELCLISKEISYKLEQYLELKCGCYYILSSPYNIIDLKKICVDFEEHHKYGRLFDIDVITQYGKSIKRTSVGYSERKCIVCDNEFRKCRVEKAHSIESIKEIVTKRLNEYVK